MLMVALALYALVDCVRTPRDMMPAKLPKALWILIILLFQVIGPIAWIIVSRVAAAEDKGGRFEPTVWSSRDPVRVTFGREKPSAAPQTPDDDPEFLESLERRIRDKKREEYQRKQREAEEKKLQKRQEKRLRREARKGGTADGSTGYGINDATAAGGAASNPNSGVNPDSEQPAKSDDDSDSRKSNPDT